LNWKIKNLNRNYFPFFVSNCDFCTVTIFKISFNEINGGSIRCYATHKEYAGHDEKVNYSLINETRQKEFDLEPPADIWGHTKFDQDRVKQNGYSSKKKEYSGDGGSYDSTPLYSHFVAHL